MMINSFNFLDKRLLLSWKQILEKKNIFNNNLFYKNLKIKFY
jgi:hypothetical protein